LRVCVTVGGGSRFRGTPNRRVAFFVWLVGGLLLVAVGGARAGFSALSEQVYAEYPRLDPQHPQHAGLSDWDAVCMLREFSYRHTNWASLKDSEAYRRGAAVVERLRNGESSLAEVYAFFDRDGGGVLCGHTALLLERLYRDFGYEAWCVGTGFSPQTKLGSRFTHVQTLVRIAEGDGAESRIILALQDPSTNVGFVDTESGRPLDYLALLRRLVRRQADTVATVGAITDGVTRSSPVTIVFADQTTGQEPSDFTDDWPVGRDYEWEPLGEGKWKFTAPRTPEMLEHLGDRWWKAELIAEGLPPDPLFLHLFFRSVTSGSEDQVIATAARAIVRNDPAAAEWYRKQENPVEAEVAAAEAAAALRRRVFAEYPRLDPQHPQHATLSEWDRVCMLRDFSYRHTNYANQVNGESYRRGKEEVERLYGHVGTLEEIYTFFEHDGGGVVCGHAALVLERLYREFGYEAWRVGVGFSPPTENGGSFTHMQTLVRIADGDGGERRDIVVLQDPSINVGYVDAESRRPLDYFELLHRLVRREADTVVEGGAVADAATRRDPVTIAFADETSVREMAEFASSWNVGPDSTWEDLGGGKWKWTGPRSPETFDRSGDRWWKLQIAAEGLPPDLLYLHLFFRSINHQTDDPALTAAARAIVRDDPASAAWFLAQESSATPKGVAAAAPGSAPPGEAAAGVAATAAMAEPAPPAETSVPTFIEWIRVRLILFIAMAAASVALLVFMGRGGRWSVWGLVPPLVATGLAGGFAAFTQALPRPEVLAVLLVFGPALGWVMHRRAGRGVSA